MLRNNYSLFVGLVGLAVAVWAGTHLQHAIEAPSGRHIGETLALSLTAVGVLLLSRRGSQKRH